MRPQRDCGIHFFPPVSHIAAMSLRRTPSLAVTVCPPLIFQIARTLTSDKTLSRLIWHVDNSSSNCRKSGVFMPQCYCTSLHRSSCFIATSSRLANELGAAITSRIDLNGLGGVGMRSGYYPSQTATKLPQAWHCSRRCHIATHPPASRAIASAHPHASPATLSPTHSPKSLAYARASAVSASLSGPVRIRGPVMAHISREKDRPLHSLGRGFFLGWKSAERWTTIFCVTMPLFS
jgi:hypothetical protein